MSGDDITKELYEALREFMATCERVIGRPDSLMAHVNYGRAKDRADAALAAYENLGEEEG